MTAAATPVTALVVSPPQAPPPAHPYETAGVWSLLTLAGSVIAAGLSTMLRAQPEPARVVWGRSFGALIAGVLGSRVAAAAYPNIWQWCTDPLLLISLAVGFGMMGYALSHPLVNNIGRISPRLLRPWLRSLVKEVESSESGRPTVMPPETTHTP